MAGCLSATLPANVKVFSMFQLGSDIMLVKDKLWKIRCLIFYCWLNMTNVKLLFEVIFYKFIYLQGRYPECIVCAMKCYWTLNLIWKVCVRKLLSLFIWQKFTRLVSYHRCWNDKNLIRTKMSVARDRDQILSFCLILPFNLNIYLLLFFVYCFAICHRWQMMQTQN